VNVGDLVTYGIEMAIILKVKPYLDEPRPGHPLDDVLWLRCLWYDGNISEIASDEVEVLSECR
jgi:hypothetical protein